MSYPVSTILWGVGVPEITLASADSIDVQGAIQNSTTGIQAFDLDHVTEVSIGFDRVRYDGGATRVTLQNGQVIQRADGLRVNVSLSWTDLDISDMRELILIYNWSLTGAIYLRPHNDVPARYRVIPGEGFVPSLTGGLYLAHDVTLSFIGTEVLSSIPNSSTVAEWAPLTF